MYNDRSEWKSIMDICVVGAGIGGLALAHGLLADGHRVRVLERAAGPTRGGAAVTIFTNGAAALTGLGVDLGRSAPSEDACSSGSSSTDGAPLGAPIETLTSVDAYGRRIMRADLTVLRRRTGHQVRTMPRAELIDRLTAGLPTGTVRYGAAVESVRTGAGGAEVVSAAGTERYDVVVGADGHRSAVRRSVLSPAPADEVGWDTWQGLTEVLPSIAAGRTGLLAVGTAGLVGMMPAGQGRTQWWFDVRRGAGPEPADVGTVDWLRRLFDGYAEPVPELLAGIADTDLGRYPHVLHRIPDRWGEGPVTLLGDAAHVFPPSQAQGANQALEDAWLLRRALHGDPGDAAAALRRYERRRVPHVRLVSRLAASERTNLPVPPALALLARLTPPRAGGYAYLRLLRRFSSVLADERP
jgi:FAD-dependent urate hydroxylase